MDPSGIKRTSAASMIAAKFIMFIVYTIGSIDCVYNGNDKVIGIGIEHSVPVSHFD